MSQKALTVQEELGIYIYERAFIHGFYRALRSNGLSSTEAFEKTKLETKDFIKFKLG